MPWMGGWIGRPYLMDESEWSVLSVLKNKSTYSYVSQSTMARKTRDTGWYSCETFIGCGYSGQGASERERLWLVALCREGKDDGYEERAMEMTFSCTGKMERLKKPFVGLCFCYALLFSRSCCERHARFRGGILNSKTEWEGVGLWLHSSWFGWRLLFMVLIHCDIHREKKRSTTGNRRERT